MRHRHLRSISRSSSGQVSTPPSCRRAPSYLMARWGQCSVTRPARHRRVQWRHWPRSCARSRSQQRGLEVGRLRAAPPNTLLRETRSRSSCARSSLNGYGRWPRRWPVGSMRRCSPAAASSSPPSTPTAASSGLAGTSSSCARCCRTTRRPSPARTTARSSGPTCRSWPRPSQRSRTRRRAAAPLPPTRSTRWCGARARVRRGWSRRRKRLRRWGRRRRGGRRERWRSSQRAPPRRSSACRPWRRSSMHSRGVAAMRPRRPRGRRSASGSSRRD